MSEAKQGFPKKERIYPTEKEERIYCELKERYGIRDAFVVKSQLDKGIPQNPRSTKDKLA